MNKNKVCIIDYKTGGNIFSVKNSLEAVGAETSFSSDPKEIKSASKIFFPGQGSFKTAMQNLNDLELTDIIKEKALSGIPFFGICVGMQILFSAGSEGDEETKGLGIFEGRVDKFEFQEKLKIPHMGWNKVKQCKDSDSQDPLFKGVKNDENFYFVHSYRVKLDDAKSNLEKFSSAEIRKTSYGEEFLSYIWNGDNLFASQCHTEKSGEAGLQLLKNFVGL